VDSDKPEFVGGTRTSDIDKKGLTVEEYLVFADERHTTGTDVPLKADAIGMMTIDKDMLSRSLFQTIMRLRAFFLNQDGEFIIPEHVLNYLSGQFPQLVPEQKNQQKDLQIVMSILLNAIKNQAIAKAKNYFRSCKAKIDNLFRQHLLTELLP